MKHLTVIEYGTIVGLSSERLQVRQEGKLIAEFPLSRMRSVTIAKNGIVISSDLVLQCAARGIRIFFLDFKGECAALLTGHQEHAVARVRSKQFLKVADPIASARISRELIYGKIRNQRAVVLYFSKYLSKQNSKHDEMIKRVSETLRELSETVKDDSFWGSKGEWRAVLMGMEGAASRAYWEVLRSVELFSQEFKARVGRNAEDLTNKCLNYGYAILGSAIWQAVVNAGLEPYAGMIHVERPGKPSLVLDLMEEYRPWVVDRTVVKLRHLIAEEEGTELGTKLKKALVSEIRYTLEKRYPYRSAKKVLLTTIIQRQIYRLSGAFNDGKRYQPYLFKW